MVAAGPLSHRPSPDKVDDRQQDYGAEKGHEEARNTEIILVDGRRAQEWRNEPAGQHRTDDADKDVQDDSLPCVSKCSFARSAASMPALLP
jgi:hypothetical protein